MHGANVSRETLLSSCPHSHVLIGDHRCIVRSIGKETNGSLTDGKSIDIGGARLFLQRLRPSQKGAMELGPYTRAINCLMQKTNCTRYMSWIEETVLNLGNVSREMFPKLSTVQGDS